MCLIYQSDNNCQQLQVSMKQNCPLCHHSLFKKTLQPNTCSNPQCTYLQIHPISYQDQVFIGPQSSKNQKSRCNQIEHQTQQSVLDSFFKSCIKETNDCCHFFKYTELIKQIASGIIGKAIQAFSETILKQQSEQQNVVVTDKKRGKQMRVKNIVSFSIFASCYQRQFILQQTKIAKYFEFSLKQWKENVKRQVCVLKQYVHDLPPIRCPLYTLKKVCKIRRINQQQQDQMLQLCKKMQNSLLTLGKELEAATLAGIAFWKMMQRAQNSQQDLNFLEICASHEDIYQETSSIPFKNIEKYFDASATNLKKVFKVYFEKDFGAKYLNEDNKSENVGKIIRKNYKVL